MGKLSHKNLFRVGFVRQVAIALVLAVSLSVISAPPAAAISLGDYFEISYDPVEFSKDVIHGSEIFYATIRGSAKCTKDLPLPVGEAITTSRVVAEHNDTKVVLNPSYTINIKPFPGKAGETYAIEKVIALQFPASSESGNYEVIGELIKAEVKAFIWVDVTEYFPQTQAMGSVEYIALGDEPPTIAYSPSSFSFTATEGGANPANKTLTIWNSGGGTLNWLVSHDANWLSLSPPSGTSTSGTDYVTLSVDIFGMDTDIYNAIITISAPGATNTPQTVPVSLTINPQETVTPPNIPSGASSGEVDQSLTYDTGGSSSNLGHSLQYRFDWGDGIYSSWSFSTTASHSWSSPGTYIVKAQARCATHTDVVSDWSGGKSVTINPPLPTIALSPSSFSFSASQGSNSSSQTLSLSNSGSGTLDWLVSHDATWLTLTPTSGTSSGEKDYVTLSVDVSGMSAGSYSATITISAPGATNTPRTVPVSLTIIGEDTKVHIVNIDMGLTSTWWGWRTYATATVSIADAQGNPVAGATVSGHWEGATRDTDSAITDSLGRVKLSSNAVWKAANGTRFTFTVDNVTKGGWTYQPEANIETTDSIVKESNGFFSRIWLLLKSFIQRLGSMFSEVIKL